MPAKKPLTSESLGQTIMTEIMNYLKVVCMDMVYDDTILDAIHEAVYDVCNSKEIKDILRKKVTEVLKDEEVMKDLIIKSLSRLQGGNYV